MRGYLQRLVSNVQAPRTAIRPVLGSLFSSSISNGAAEGPQEIEEVRVSRPRGVRPIPQSPQAILPQAQPAPFAYNVPHLTPQPPLTEVSKPGVDTEPVQDAHGPFTPLIRDIPETQRPTPAADNPIPPLESISASESQGTGPPLYSDSAVPGYEIEFEGTLSQHDQSSRQASSQDIGREIINGDVPQRGKVQLQAAHESVPPRQPYSQLLLESIRRIDTEFIRPTAALSSRRMTASASHQNKARPQADDIQIHIGRIEVTAVPSAPVLPQAAPVRKSLKLDEYLRRGRGSAS